ncbi:unnamed protein product [Cuscuta campestris]|uniref:Uncharacterized protein n=1 Tax=Cuscuta campestris TaxID=132261 RepID=A0A484MHP3_9ASTE|nr:unnamed protein product [Cuscuta campestris]
MTTERDGGGGYGYGSGGSGGYSYGWGGKGGYGGRGWGGPGGGGGSWGGGGGGSWGGGGGGGCHHGCCGHYNRWGGCKYCCHNAEEAVSYLKREVYYINWRTGKRVKEDPRITAVDDDDEEEDYEEDDDDEDDVSDGESGSSSSSSEESAILKDAHRLGRPENSTAAVLVVAGCQSCLMYFMVPKEVKSCPKCFGQLLHFDRSDPSSCPP